MKSPPTIKVKRVRVAPSGRRLHVEFSDGTSGTADFSKLVESAPFDRVQKRADFAAAYVDFGAVEWPSGVGIAPEAVYAMVHGLKRPRSFTEAKQNELSVALREFRKSVGAKQPEVARAMGIDQSTLSRFESGEDPKLSTIQRYVQALGGVLEVVAVVDGRRRLLAGGPPLAKPVATRRKQARG